LNIIFTGKFINFLECEKNLCLWEVSKDQFYVKQVNGSSRSEEIDDFQIRHKKIS
jgi:hypothetical protein